MFLSHFPNAHIVTIHDSKSSTAVPYTIGKPVPRGHGVFFSANGSKASRKREDLKEVRAVFADFDYKGIPVPGLQDLPVDWMGVVPSIVNRTKNGYHCYWLLKEPIEVTSENYEDVVETVEGIHRWFVKHWNADNGAKDITHLLRVPGYEHRKNPDDPFMVTTVHECDARYTLPQLTAAFPPIAKEQKRVTENKGDHDFDIRQVVIDVWAEKGDQAEFDNADRLVWNGQKTGTFIGRHGDNYIATTSMDFPYKGNPTTYVAGVLGITTKQAYKWLIEKYGAPERDIVSQEISIHDIDMESLMYIENKSGRQYLANDENIIRIFNHYKLAKYDTFNGRAYLRVCDVWKIRDDGSDGELYSWLVDKFPFLAKCTAKKIGELLTYVQYRNKFDSAQDYVNSLQWDGVSRLDTWLPKVFFVEEDSYYRDIGSKWFMGLVARIINPGCKFDNALVVHGGQKIGKSSVFLIIAGDDNHIEFTDLKVREMQQDMQGKLVVEFAEAAIFSKADSESLKSIVSRKMDTFRIPYERHPRDFPRRCVFAVTANNDDILKDSTGGRRWWAVDVPDDMKVYPPKRQADIHWLRDNRDQLFAEAAVRVRNGEDYQNVDEYELMKHQKSITATEQDEDLFYRWYHGLRASAQNAGCTNRQAYCRAYKQDRYGVDLKEDTVSISKTDEMRVGRILKKLGLEKKHTKNGNLWVPGELFERDFEVKHNSVVEEIESNW